MRIDVFRLGCVVISSVGINISISVMLVFFNDGG